MSEYISTTLLHLNGNCLCSVDVKTTGPDSTEHEIYEIGIIPIDAFFRRREDKKPLDLRMRPNYPEKIDWENLEKKNTKAAIQNALDRGLPQHVGMNLFERWVADLKMPERKRIAPIGYCYGRESRFLRQWIGELTYESMFDDTEIRDVQNMAKFMNDLANSRSAKYPFTKINLNYLATEMKVWTDYGNQRSAIHEAAIIGDVYREMLRAMKKEMI